MATASWVTVSFVGAPWGLDDFLASSHSLSTTRSLMTCDSHRGGWSGFFSPAKWMSSTLRTGALWKQDYRFVYCAGWGRWSSLQCGSGWICKDLPHLLQESNGKVVASQNSQHQTFRGEKTIPQRIPLHKSMCLTMSHFTHVHRSGYRMHEWGREWNTVRPMQLCTKT